MKNGDHTRAQDAQLRWAAMERPMLSQERELELTRKYQQDGDLAAREEVMLAHEKLVLGVAKRFRRSGVPLQDMVNEGHCALMRALETYDPESGHRFSTYASWWIRTYIQDYCMQNMTTVRIGRSRGERNGVRALARGDRDAARAQGLSESEIVRLERALNPVVFSLHEPAGEDGESDYEALLSDENAAADQMMEMAVEETRGNVVAQALSHLDDREKHIIRQRFFIEEKRTLRDISQELEISPERVRQIERAALGRLRRAIEQAGFVADDLIASAAPVA